MFDFLALSVAEPVYYFTAVVTVIFSIVLHELAHGWAAMWQGDDTPRMTGHMTPDPITHMGPLGFACVFLIGIGWGAMPVDPTRFRSRYGDAIVSFAGPLMNLSLALAALTTFGLLYSDFTVEMTEVQINVRMALFVFGIYNIALFLFNLLPVVPLDGSRILANLHHGYARWVYDNEHMHQFLFIATFMLIMGLGGTPYGLFSIATQLAMSFLSLFGNFPHMGW